ncbi:MAG: hypothetical protein K0Q61_2294, partial [Rhodococcus erythropolis]|nr:hypothetical protein [Rhodococcus erythropolis]
IGVPIAVLSISNSRFGFVLCSRSSNMGVWVTYHRNPRSCWTFEKFRRLLGPNYRRHEWLHGARRTQAGGARSCLAPEIRSLHNRTPRGPGAVPGRADVADTEADGPRTRWASPTPSVFRSGVGRLGLLSPIVIRPNSSTPPSSSTAFAPQHFPTRAQNRARGGCGENR